MKAPIPVLAAFAPGGVRAGFARRRGSARLRPAALFGISARGARARSSLDDYASARLTALAYAADEAEGGEERLNFDWWVDGSDWRITGLSLRLERSRDPARRTIIARFRNFARPVRLRFRFVRERGGWYLDEVASASGWTLSALLSERP